MNRANWEIALNKFIDRLRALYQDNISEIILYGSRARGEGESSSDIDLLVVVNDPQKKRLIEEDCATIANEVSLEYDLVFSVMIFSEKHFQLSYEPLIINVRREGKRVA